MGMTESAHYKEQIIVEYRGNPFIEALPVIYDVGEVIEKLTEYPTFEEEEKILPPHLKVHSIQRIFNYFQPLPMHIDLESRISRLIRQGYVWRNPFSPYYIKQMNDNCEIQNYYGDIFADNNRTTGSGLTIIGVSGLGKSTAINRIMSLYPAVIVHESYKNKRFAHKQMVWMKLDCPHDGSLKSLCLSFFQKVDDHLGTSYFQRYGSGRQAVSVLVPVMAKVAQSISLGLLIIDEIQHASLGKSGGAEKMLNFFVTLVNLIGLPVVLIGTPSAMKLLQSQFRQARRGSGQGDMIWDRLENDESWKLLLDGLWRYQWTDELTIQTEGLINLLYEKSQGITDIAIKIFAMGQIHAIMTGEKCLNENLVEYTAENYLRLIQPMIEAIKRKDIRAMGGFEDIYLPKIDNFIIPDIESDYSRRMEAILKVRNEKSRSNNPKTKQNSEVILSKRTKGNQQYDERDLKEIVLNGKKSGITSYEALKEKGYIKEETWSEIIGSDVG
ncbi:ATP-binding protein [Anoxynatronum buryatiense]|uniref:AAA domain-containing protein n=1 Tax=Anoxynatronum buryatiense TaxID=489973 RepID=A0AA46AKL0_9CLOT|nr:ATP-binding protein [Anoxynatronum buryatiense]SMP72002.1 AAA domain-containing protein [Anoxynatronum buryatiense]